MGRPVPRREREWWRRAQALEAQDRLGEAEQVVRDAVPNLHFAATVAELYARRMLRLQQAGDENGARQAFVDGERWIFFYASQATSGGEGLALSRERDEFRRGLVAALGYDPSDG